MKGFPTARTYHEASCLESDSVITCKRNGSVFEFDIEGNWSREFSLIKKPVKRN